MSDETVIMLQGIKEEVQRWMDFDQEIRSKEGIETTVSTRIMGPPEWPTHGMLIHWVRALEEAAAELSELKAKNAWQSIESAPKDGTEIITGATDGSCAIYFWNGHSWDDGDFNSHMEWPTHWKPLPQAPEVE